MSEIMWFLTRSSGIVAVVLMIAAVADGLIFSGREGGRRLRPAWWLDLHKGLGGYALAFTGVHLITAVMSSETGVGLAEVFVPNASPTFTGAFTLGVLSFYGLAVTVLTSWPKRRMRRRIWHAVHLLSIPATVLAVLHAYQLGTDAREPWFLAAGLGVIGLAMYPVGLRLSGIARRHQQRLRAEATAAAPAPMQTTTGDPLLTPPDPADRVLTGAHR